MKCLHVIAIALALPILSCNTGSKKAADNITAQDNILLKPEEAKAKQFAMQPPVAGDTITTNVALQGGQPVTPDWDKQLIKTADIVIELTDLTLYETYVHDLTKRYGAYIASEQQTEQFGKKENTVVIKVPVAQFEAMINALPGKEGKVQEKSISNEDVTGEVVDVKARTEAKKQVRDRYLDLLKQAKNIKEIMEVENEINTIQEAIEAGAGRVDYLTHKAAYSTINLKYYQFITGLPINETPSFLTKVKEAFDTGTSIISGSLVLLVTFWPIVLSGLCIWLFVKRYQVKKQGLPAKKPSV